MFSKKLERVEQTVQKVVKPKSTVIEPIVKKEPVVLAAEALRMANEARLAAARLSEAKKNLSIPSTKKMEGVEQTVQKEIRPKFVVTEPIVKKEPVVVVKASVVEEPVKKEPVREEIVVVETSVEESPKEERIEEESAKEETAAVETPGEESAKEGPIEEEAPVVVEEVKEESVKENAPVAGVEEESKAGPIDHTPIVKNQRQAGIVSQNLTGSGVVKVIETGKQKVSRDSPAQNFVYNGVVRVIETGRQKNSRDAPAVRQSVPAQESKVTEDDVSSEQGSLKDFVEEKLDSSGVHKMGGVDDKRLGNVALHIVKPTYLNQRQPDPVSEVKQPTPETKQSTPASDPVTVTEIKQPTPQYSPQAQDVNLTEKRYAPRVALAPVVAPPVEQQIQIESHVVVQDYDKDIIEEFLDSLGVDKICGVDDNTLGFIDRPELPPPPPPVPPPPFENPTRVEMKAPLTPQDILHSASWKEQIANTQRKQRNLRPKTYQRAPVNSDFADPFGVDHDDLVFCGKLADLCEPPDFDDEYYVVPQHAIQPESKKKNVSFKSE